MTTILLRSDASSRAGTGHAMRCFAVGQAWRACGSRVVFATREGAPGIEAKMTGQGIELARIGAASGIDPNRETVRIAAEAGAHWTVVDGCTVDAALVAALHAAGSRVLAIDDDGSAASARPDVILNQNLHATAALYASSAPSTRLLLGPRYALLREEFRPWRVWQRSFPSGARNLLVTLGGSDPDNMTERVLRAVERIGLADLQVTVVLGGSNLHRAAVERRIAASGAAMHLAHDTSAMAKLMASADVAISSGGSTVWELAFMGLPTIVGTIAPIEEVLTAGLAAHGLFEPLGEFATTSLDDIARALRGLLADEHRRADMGTRGRALVDGRGCERVLDALRESAMEVGHAHP